MIARIAAAAVIGGLMTTHLHAEPSISQHFDLSLKLSEKLVAELAASNETIIIAAYFYGDPNAEGASHIDDGGLIQLSEERTEIPPADDTVIVNGVFDPSRLAWIEGEVRVNVNVFSGRKSSEDNLISCDFIDGPVSELTTQPTEITCGLITEDPVTVLKPAKG